MSAKERVDTGIIKTDEDHAEEEILKVSTGLQYDHLTQQEQSRCDTYNIQTTDIVVVLHDKRTNLNAYL